MILDHLAPERILLSGRARSKQEVLSELADLLAPGSPVDAPAILAALREREQTMSTGIGHGVAIPHARLAEVTTIHVALARYQRGIEFQALDHRPVYLAFGILGPPAGTGQHVKLLARIARLVKQGHVVDEILSGASVEAVTEVLRRRET